MFDLRGQVAVALARIGLSCSEYGGFAGAGGCVRFEPLYRVRFTCPESWMVGLEGGWEQHLMLAEGRCEGSIGS